MYCYKGSLHHERFEGKCSIGLIKDVKEEGRIEWYLLSEGLKPTVHCLG